MTPLCVLLLAGVIPAQAEVKLPKVERDFNGPARVDCTGKTLAALIPPASVRRVILTHNHGVDMQKPGLDSDVLIARFFKSSAKAQPYALSAIEQTVAQYVLLTKDGGVFRFEILRAMPGRGNVSALLVSGKGLRCRFDAAGAGKKAS